MKIRRNDTVLVISGKNRGKTGKVLRSYPQEGRLMVEGVNVIKRHMRRRPGATQSGIIEREAPFHESKVMFLCNKCHHPARLGLRFLEDGKKVRFCHACGEVIE